MSVLGVCIDGTGSILAWSVQSIFDFQESLARDKVIATWIRAAAQYKHEPARCMLAAGGMEGTWWRLQDQAHCDLGDIFRLRV